MANKIEEALTAGLVAGYGGHTDFATTDRGGFELKSSTFISPGVTYIDQWLPRDIGGGQELVRVDEEEFTRLYGGGVIENEKLSTSGLSVKEVIGHLIRRIATQGDKTRLFAPCHPVIENGWDYQYVLLDETPEIGALVSKETIKYHDTLVFCHYFILSPVK